MLTVVLTQVVVLQLPSKRTKYSVGADGETMFVSSGVPPQLSVYHLASAPVPSLPPEYESVVVLPGHTDGGVADALVGANEWAAL